MMASVPPSNGGLDAAEACRVNVDRDDIVAGGGGKADAAKGHRPGEVQGPRAYLSSGLPSC